MTPITEVRERLALEDEDYQRLLHKHNEYEERLQQLNDIRFPSEEEQLEETKLKKLKLVVKDHMEELVRRAAG